MKKLLIIILFSLFHTSANAAILVFSSNGIYTTKPTLAAAASSSDCVGKKVVVSGSTYALNTDLSWPTDRYLAFENGGKIKPNSHTFTYSGDMSGWPIAQVFDMSADGSVLLPKTAYGYPDYFLNNTAPGTTDMTVGVTAAINALPSGSVLRFTPNAYKVSSTSGDIFTITKNISVAGTRNGTTIIAYVSNPTNAIFKVSVTSNNGYLDVRHQTFSGLAMFFAGPTLGSSSIYATMREEGNLPHHEFTVENCQLQGVNAAAITFDGAFAFSDIRYNELENGVNFINKCADGQRIRDNSISGTMNTPGIMMDATYGSYTHIIEGNVIANKNGAIRIINGSQVKITKNQIEQFYFENASPYNAMITVGEGTGNPDYCVGGGTPPACVGGSLIPYDFQSFGVVIEDNNIGGGSNVATDIAVLNATATSIDKNVFPGITTSSFINFAGVVSSGNFIGDKNLFGGVPVNGQIYNGTGSFNYGAIYGSNALTFSNGWGATANMTYMLRADRTLIFTGGFTGGTTTTSTLIAVLPSDIRPTATRYISVGTSTGAGTLSVDSSGNVRVISLPSADAYLDGVTLKL